MPDFQSIDAGTVSRFTFEDSKLHHAWESTDEDRIMAENQALAGSAKTLSWGRPTLRMSWAQYWYFLKLYPELDPRNKADRELRRWRWNRIAHDIDFNKLVVGKF